VNPSNTVFARAVLRRLAVFVVALLGLLWSAPATADAPTYRWGGGSKKGGFTKISKAIGAGLEATGADMKIDVQTTKGSCDNIKRLLRHELDFAMVQYDVAAEAFQAGQHAELSTDDEEKVEGGGGFMCNISAEMAAGVKLRLVTAVTDGAVHVLVRRPLRLDDFRDLSDYSVYLGRDGSGSFETSKVIVGAAGLTVDRLDRLDSGTGAAFKALRKSEIMMMLRTTEPGDDRIGRVVADGVATVNPLPPDVTDRLIDGYPYYRICQIEANTYPGMEVVVPTVCVSTVVLTVLPEGEDPKAMAELDAAVDEVLKAVRWLETAPDFKALHIRHLWHGFAESEPIPIHRVATEIEQSEMVRTVIQGVGWTVLLLLLVLVVRRLLRRRGLLKDPLEANLEGSLSNPLIPFAGFVAIVVVATFIVWSLEHDSNARVRTLNDSFWEMNMFATGNFDTETLKTSTARFIGAGATIAGLGLLAWFTAALTNIFGQDQLRIWRRLKNHIVILNFREDMLQLIRMLRSPGPMRSRPIHVVISDELPKRVRLQLARIKGVTIYQRNPEVPEDLALLRIPRAARVIVLRSDADAATQYHPLRVSRAVHQACSKYGTAGATLGPELGKTGFSVAPPTQSPALAGDDNKTPSLPVTLVEAPGGEPLEIFDPFRRWLIPIKERQLANHWMATACVDPGFAEVFNGVVSFRDDNSEAYTVPFPDWFHGKTWRVVRRTLMGLEARAGVIPVGLYRSTDSTLAYNAADIEGSSPQRELQKRMVVNPPLDTIVGEGDRLLAFAEDEADLRKVMKQSRGVLASHHGS